MFFLDRTLKFIQKNNITKNKLLSELGLSKNCFVRWEKGSVPSADIVSKIADYFDCSVDYLLGRTDTPSSQTEAKEWNPTFDNYLKLDPFCQRQVDQYVENLLEENQIENIKIVESDRGQVAAFGGGLGTPEKTESHLTEEDVRKLIEEYIDKD